MFRVSLLLALMLAGLPTARADVQPAPFSEQELEEALSPRVPAALRPRLAVELTDQRVLIRFGAVTREVDLGQARGAEAARVVALIAAELALVTPAPTPVRAAPQPAHPPRARGLDGDRVRLGVDFAVQRGLLAEESFSFDLGIGASLLLHERMIVALRAGYWTAPTAHSPSTGTGVRFDALSLRPAIGVRFSLFELSAGGLLAPYWVSGGVGHRDQLFGLSAQCALWQRAFRALRVFARLSFDGFFNRARLLVGADRVLTTPRLMLGLALGFAWGRG